MFKITGCYIFILLLSGFLVSCSSSGGSEDPQIGGEIPIQPPPDSGSAGSPDLDIRNHQVSDTTLTVGDRFDFDVEVYNYNFADVAPSTTLRYYRSPNSIITRNDTEEGDNFVRSLNPGETDSKSITLTATTAGTYYYGACVDEVPGEYDPDDDCTEPSEAVRVEISLSTGGTTPPPSGGGNSDAGIVQIILTDGCPIRGALNVRYYARRVATSRGAWDGVWPEAGQVYTTNANTGTIGPRLDARGLARVCFGAEIRGADFHWGVGIDGDQSCSNCCFEPSSTRSVVVRRTLTCANQ